MEEEGYFDELDWIVGVAELPKCLGFGSYDDTLACPSWVKKRSRYCLECKRITENEPNLWKSFDKKRRQYIKHQKVTREIRLKEGTNQG